MTMATSEPLVPKDRPHGERQKLVQQMQAGGIPTGVQAGSGSTPTAGSGDSPPQRSAAGPVDTSSFDVFANRQPTQPQQPEAAPAPITTGGVLAETAQTANNPSIREFATRMTQLRRG